MRPKRLQPSQLRALRSFCVVARHLSFKKAADELCLSASAVSHQLSDLEEELGVSLFHRHTRSISLSDRGAQFFAAIAPCLDDIDSAVDRLRADASRHPLRVQVPEFFASELLMPGVASFTARHPDIDLRIESMEIGNAGTEDADIHIVLTRKTPVAARVEKLFPIHYLPACSTTHRRDCHDPEVPLQDIIRESTILLHRARPQVWAQWTQHVGLGGIAPKQFIHVDSMFALARAAQQGAGIAMLPLPVSRAWFDTGLLLPLHDSALPSEDYYWIALGRATTNVAAESFWNWMLQRLRSHGEEDYRSVRRVMAEPDSSVA